MTQSPSTHVMLFYLSRSVIRPSDPLFTPLIRIWINTHVRVAAIRGYGRFAWCRMFLGGWGIGCAESFRCKFGLVFCRCVREREESKTEEEYTFGILLVELVGCGV
jgi:hypothetical protein